MDALRVAELARALRQLDHLSPADRAKVEHLSQALLNINLFLFSILLFCSSCFGRFQTG